MLSDKIQASEPDLNKQSAEQALSASLSKNMSQQPQAYDLSMSLKLVARLDLHGHLLLETQAGQTLDAPVVLEQLRQQKSLQREVAIVWVPTEQVMMSTVKVPGKRKAHWLAALPFALEETLSTSLDEYHILALHRDKQEQVAALAVGLNTMQVLQDALHKHGLTHALLVADCFRIPFQAAATDPQQESLESSASDSETWLVCSSPYIKETRVEKTVNQHFLIRTSEYQGFAANDSWLTVLKNQYCQQTNHAIALREYAVDKHELLASSQPSLFQVKGLSLSQGAFKPATQNQTSWTEWRWVGVLVLLLGLTWIAMQVLQTKQLEQQVQYTQTQTEKLFKTMFPETKRIVNIKSQTLTKLRQADTQSHEGQSLMPLLQRLEAVLVKQPKVKLLELSWNPKKTDALELQVEAPVSADLERLIKASQQASANLKLRLRLKNVTSERAEGVIYVDAN